MFSFQTSIPTSEKSVGICTSAKVSPDGKFIAVSQGTSYLLYNVSDGLSAFIPTSHVEPMSDICWSPDSQCIATASDDFTIEINHITYGRLHRLVGHTAPVLSLVYTSKGNLLCSASMDESIKIWDVLTGTLLKTTSAHSEPVVSIDMPVCDPSILSSGSYDGLIRIFDTTTGHCLKTLTYDKDWKSENGVVPISQVKFSVNGKYLLVKSLDGVLKIWDFIRGSVVRTFKICDSTKLKYSCGMDFLYPSDQSSSPVVVAGGESDGIYCWDAQSKKLLQHINYKHQNSPVVSVSCQGTTMCSLSLNGECNIWKWEK